MFFGPRLPSRDPLLLLCKPFRFRKGIPRCHSRVRLAAEKHREKCVVRTHEISFPLYALRAQKKLVIAAQMIDAGRTAGRTKHWPTNQRVGAPDRAIGSQVLAH